MQALVDRLVGQGLSGSKVRNAIMPLRVVCRHAVRRDELLANPTADLELPVPAAGRDRADSAAAAASLLAALDDDERALYATALYAGLRRGELRALDCQSVDLKAGRGGRIAVSQSWDEYEGFVEPKSRKGTRTVPIPRTLKPYLAEHLARTGRRCGDLVFGRAPSAPFTATAVRKRALRAWAKANAERAANRLEPLRPIGLHECRHVYTTWLYAAGVPDETVKDLLGHSRQGVTERYRHPQPETLDEAAASLDGYLARASGAARLALNN